VAFGRQTNFEPFHLQVSRPDHLIHEGQVEGLFGLRTKFDGPIGLFMKVNEPGKWLRHLFGSLEARSKGNPATTFRIDRLFPSPLMFPQS
jgi:hypothetical protein